MFVEIVVVVVVVVEGEKCTAESDLPSLCKTKGVAVVPVGKTAR